MPAYSLRKLPGTWWRWITRRAQGTPSLPRRIRSEERSEWHGARRAWLKRFDAVPRRRSPLLPEHVQHQQKLMSHLLQRVGLPGDIPGSAELLTWHHVGDVVARFCADIGLDYAHLHTHAPRATQAAVLAGSHWTRSHRFAEESGPDRTKLIPVLAEGCPRLSAVYQRKLEAAGHLLRWGNSWGRAIQEFCQWQGKVPLLTAHWHSLHYRDVEAWLAVGYRINQFQTLGDMLVQKWPEPLPRPPLLMQWAGGHPSKPPGTWPRKTPTPSVLALLASLLDELPEPLPGLEDAPRQMAELAAFFRWRPPPLLPLRQFSSGD